MSQNHTTEHKGNESAHTQHCSMCVFHALCPSTTYHSFCDFKIVCPFTLTHLATFQPSTCHLPYFSLQNTKIWFYICYNYLSSCVRRRSIQFISLYYYSASFLFFIRCHGIKNSAFPGWCIKGVLNIDPLSILFLPFELQAISLLLIGMHT